MKKLYILMAALLALAFFAIPAMAATDTVDVEVTVNTYCAITVDDTVDWDHQVTWNGTSWATDWTVTDGIEFYCNDTYSVAATWTDGTDIGLLLYDKDNAYSGTGAILYTGNYTAPTDEDVSFRATAPDWWAVPTTGNTITVTFTIS